MAEDLPIRGYVYSHCPICDSLLKYNGSFSDYFGEKVCFKGHYKYKGNGSYASWGIIILDGREEKFNFDDMFDDSDAFYTRVREIRGRNEK